MVSWSDLSRRVRYKLFAIGSHNYELSASFAAHERAHYVHRAFNDVHSAVGHSYIKHHTPSDKNWTHSICLSIWFIAKLFNIKLKLISIHSLQSAAAASATDSRRNQCVRFAIIPSYDSLTTNCDLPLWRSEVSADFFRLPCARRTQSHTMANYRRLFYWLADFSSIRSNKQRNHTDSECRLQTDSVWCGVKMHVRRGSYINEIMAEN